MHKLNGDVIFQMLIECLISCSAISGIMKSTKQRTLGINTEEESISQAQKEFSLLDMGRTRFGEGLKQLLMITKFIYFGDSL
nr:hypothetical protein [Tanacetum cinerariifolium]